MDFRILACIFLVSLLQDMSGASMNELLFRMRQVTSPAEFLESMVRDENGEKINLEEEEHQYIESGEGVLASGEAVALAGMDFCSVRNVTYKFPKDKDPNIVYFPECTIVEQCGGCCNTEILQCRPTRNVTLEMKTLVVRYNYDSPSRFQYVGFKKFQVVQHTSCSPLCKTLPADCHPIRHTYSPEECRCECRPSFVRTCPDNKRFDNKQCDCVCKEVKTCASESRFDRDSCECVSGLFASGGEARRTTAATPTTTDRCAGYPPCPSDWSRVLLNNNACGCRPTARFFVGAK